MSLSLNKVEENDLEHVRDVFLERLKGIEDTDVSYQYYYQYECDPNLTLYEKLMDTHQIAIEAQSYSEAMLLNALLRVLIDGHASSLEDFVNESNDGIDFETIEDSNAMDAYKEYCSRELRYPNVMNVGDGKIYLNMDEIHPVIVFNRYNVIQLLKTLQFGDRKEVVMETMRGGYQFTKF